MNKEDWYFNIIREMIKNKIVFYNLGTMKIVKDKDTLTAFNFNISISKSLFEDLLSEEEKAFLLLEEKVNEMGK